jgi:hypothetical protein
LLRSHKENGLYKREKAFAAEIFFLLKFFLVAFDVAMQTNTALVTSKERRLFSKREKKEVKQVDWTDVFKLK